MAPDQLERMERLLLDWRFLIRGPEVPSGDVVIVAYDEMSIRHFGRWPPSRSLLADAIDRVAEEGAAAIALDYLFLEPQQSASHEIREFLGRVTTGLPPDDPLRAEAQRIADDDAADRRLAASIARAGNVILAFAYSPDAGITEIPDDVTDWAIVQNSSACTQPNVVEIAPRLQAPIPSLAEAAALGGNVNVNYDVDGAPRFEFMASAIDGYCFAPLSLAGTAIMRGIAWTDVGIAFGQHVSLAGNNIAIDPENQVMVNYFGPSGTIRTISFGDVISGRLPPNVFDGKMVFFGTNFLGGTDQFRSPFDLTLSGVERHATVAERLLHGGSIVRPAGSLYLSLAAIIVLGGLAAVLARRLATGPGVAANAGLALGWFVLSYFALFPYGIWVNALYPIAAILLGTALQLALRAVEEEQRRRIAQAELAQSEERYALAARGANDGLWDWDMLAGTFYTSPRWQQMLGLRADRMSNLPGDWFDRVHRDDIDILRAAIDAHLSGSSTHLEQELRMRHADGEDRWVTVRGMAVRDADGRAARFAGSMTDITARKLAERQLMFNALHSHLTGLPNRALLIDRTDQALQLWSRDRNADVILAVLDLDRFGHFNESLGQRVGDDILIMLARNLEAVMRPDDTLAHLGEDEFAITRFAAGNVEAQVEELVGTLKSVLGQRLEIGDRLLEIEASIGVVIASQAAGAAADELLRDANLALYRAKAQGRNQVVRFEPSMHQSAMKRFGLEADLKRAIAAGDQLELFYQPIIDLKDGRLHGFEALIRWRHPERGMISPVDFIPLAEDTDMIVEIGRRSIMEAARQIAAWMPADGDPPQIAVNVSGKQFMAPGLLEDIERTLQKTGIPKGSLKLEVTESLIMDNPERTAEILRKVITMGCKVSIDDFGTGYSSLSHLHRFPFNTLKIDRSFVMRIAESREGLEIVRVISSLAHILERDVVAEGVETEEQAALLAKLGIQYGQGYLWSKPLPANEASVFLAKNRQKFQLH
jgi:diguanylate cyclase (GGDEF)-like protein/PAS domain S-box-containing protein